MSRDETADMPRGRTNPVTPRGDASDDQHEPQQMEVEPPKLPDDRRNESSNREQTRSDR